MKEDEEILSRLTRVFGHDKGQQLFDEVLNGLDVASLQIPQDQLRFANRLITRGGLYEVLGRTLKVRALLLGASATTSTFP